MSAFPSRLGRALEAAALAGSAVASFVLMARVKAPCILAAANAPVLCLISWVLGQAVRVDSLNIAQETAVAVERIGSASVQIASQTRTIRERVGAFTQHIRAMRA